MKRPLVPVHIRTEFGDVIEDGAFYDNAAQDLTYVPGYSDIRRARDLAKGLDNAERLTLSADEDEASRGRDTVRGIRDGIRRNLAKAGMELPAGNFRADQVPHLPVRLHWARTAKVSGAPESIKQVQFSTKGYRQVTEADVGQSWLKSMPAGARPGVGGAIYQGDTVLMVCDDKRAARNAAQIRAQVDKMTQSAAAGDLMRLGEKFKGSDPSYSAEAGPTIKAPPSAIKG